VVDGGRRHVMLAEMTMMVAAAAAAAAEKLHWEKTLDCLQMLFPPLPILLRLHQLQYYH